MSYSISIFQELIQKFPSWEAFETYLTSPDGGNIRSVGEGRYRVLRYTKGVSDLSLPHTKWMRSVIWDTERHLPVCVAPPKAEKGDPVTGDSVSYPIVEDFLDGIMINVFRGSDDAQVQIATRTQIGAGGKFYSEKTFAQMFEEALVAMNYTKEDLVKQIPPNHFVSFLLQHPEHRVVARCRSPHLWLIHSGSIHENGVVSINEANTSWPERFHLTLYLNAIEGGDAMKSPELLNAFFSNLCEKRGWFYQGIVIKDGKGNRWRMRNPNYLYLRSLRGSEATSVDRFLRLRAESKVSEYLKHYSEDRQTFWNFEQTLRSKTQEAFQAYCDVHKSHSKKFDELEWSIKPCVFKLHAHYLEHLRPNNEKVMMKQAVDLVNNLATYEQKRLLSSSGSAAST